MSAERILYTDEDVDQIVASKDDRIAALERELAARPTADAYEAACRALHHWRAEARRMAEITGLPAREMIFK